MRITLALLIVCAWIASTGCSVQSLRHEDLVDVDAELNESSFKAPFDPALGVTTITLAKVDIGLVLTGSRSQFEELVRSQFTQIFAASGNVAVSNRNVLRETEAEWRLIGAGMTEARQAPPSMRIATPDYIVNITIASLTRDHREAHHEGRGRISDFGADLRQKARIGEVELVFEVVEFETQDTAASFTTRGRLADTRAEQIVRTPLVNVRRTTAMRVPEAFGTREAIELGLTRFHDFLRQRDGLAARTK